MTALDSLLWYIFAGSRGGPTRIRIVRALLDRPRNVNQVAAHLGLDYKTVEYNLRVLEKHRFVVRPEAGAYGAPYHASKNLAAQRAAFDTLAAALEAPAPKPASPDLGKGSSVAEPRRSQE